MPIVSPPDILRHAERLYDASEVEFAIDRLAVRMALDLQDVRPILVCVMNGGLPFAAALMRRFAFPLELDYVHAIRYRGGAEVSGTLRAPRRRRPSKCASIWRAISPTVPLCWRTMSWIGEATLEDMAARVAQAGAARVHTAVLVNKKVSGRTFRADYVALDAPDRYLIGCGMDFGGWYRNLGGIYALPREADVPA